MTKSPEGSPGLRESTVASFGWSWAGTLVALALQLAYLAVMARLVAPATFGLVAGGLLFIRVIAYLAKLGVGAAVVQRPTITPSEISAAHTVSVGSTVLLAAGAFVSAPALSRLIGVAGAAQTARWLLLGLVADSFAAVPEAMVRREMGFKRLAVVQVGVYVVSNFCVAIPLAVAGYGLDALLAANVVSSAVAAVALHGLLRPRLRFGWNGSELAQFVRFGGAVAIASFLDVVSSTTDTLLVGRLGAEPLGQYNRSTMLVGMPIQQAASAATRVTVPALSQLQRDRVRFTDAVLVAAGLTAAMVGIPVALAAASAPRLVLLLMGPRWSLAARLLPSLAIAYGLTLITQVLTSAAEAMGEVMACLRGQAISTVVALVLIVGAYGRYSSPTSLAFVWMLSEAVRLAVHLSVVAPRLVTSNGRLARRIASGIAISAATAVPAWCVVHLMTLQPLLSLAISGVAALGVLALAKFLLPGAYLWNDLRRLGLADALWKLKDRWSSGG